MPFQPKFLISAKAATSLMRIEAARQAVADLPITPSVLDTLRDCPLDLHPFSTTIEAKSTDHGTEPYCQETFDSAIRWASIPP